MGAGDTTVVSKHGVKSQWTVLNGSPQSGFHQSCIRTLDRGGRGSQRRPLLSFLKSSPSEISESTSSLLPSFVQTKIPRSDPIACIAKRDECEKTSTTTDTMSSPSSLVFYTTTVPTQYSRD